MKRKAPKNASFNSKATLKVGSRAEYTIEIWRHLGTMNLDHTYEPTTYSVSGELCLRDGDDIGERTTYMSLGVWSVGESEREAIDFFLQKVDELETFLDLNMDVEFIERNKDDYSVLDKE